MDDAPRILAGRYEVGELIGRGGMAEVHIGHDARLGRTVAIKILRSDLARDPSFQARFRREAQSAAALNHPAIVAVYDTGEDVVVEPSGNVAHVPFIVMEYVEGHTVRDILHDGSAVPLEEAVEITAGVLSALEYSHHAGIVHRDIKPANVMLTPTGAVKVMDFGIARAMADAAGTMTQTQAVIGTAQYLSPEQARGEAVDARSDLYSTGCLLFELLTGRPPFVGDSPVAVAYQHAREIPQPPSTYAADVPEALDRITMRALAKEPAQRYANAADFRADLESALRGGEISAPAVGVLGAAIGGAIGGAGAAAARGADAPTAATQVIGAGMSPTQVVTGAPWGPAIGGGPAVAAPGGPPWDRTADDDHRRPWVLWILIGIAVAAIAGIILILVIGNPAGPDQPTTVAVPNLVGMEQSAAQQKLQDVGLEMKLLTEASADVEEGLVIRTDPEAQAQVALASEVQVYVSSGPDAITVPTMTNFPQADARARLIEAGFDPANITYTPEHSPDVAKDAVTRTDPEAGASVAADSPITVFLSDGLVDLPDLRGMKEVDARKALTDRRLVPDVTQEESDQEPGTVLSQSRSAGPVEQGSTIGLVIATQPTTTVPAATPDDTCESYTVALGLAGLNLAGNACQDDTASPGGAGKVTRTDPEQGSVVPEGSDVTVYVRP